MSAGRATRGPFTVAAIAWMVGVGVVCTLALVALSAWAPELRDGNDGRGHALSRSGTGFAAAARLLGDTGYQVRLLRGPVQDGDEGGLLILTPPPGRPLTLPAGAGRDDGGLIDTTLIVLPKWVTSGDPLRPGWVETRGLVSPQGVLAVLPDDLGDDLSLSQDDPMRATSVALEDRVGDDPIGRSGPIRGLQTIAGQGWVPVIADGRGRAVLAMHNDTGTYVLAEPDLLNTAGLASVDTARAADAMMHQIWYGDGPILFDLTAWGFSAPRSVLRLALEPPLVGATLCLLAAVLLTGWQAAIRFGPHRRPERAIALGKRTLADNTAGLIRLGRRERAMKQPYAEMIRARAAAAVGLPRGLDAEETDRRLARLPGAERDYVAAQARLAAAPDAAAIAEAARDLHRWKNETTHGRR